MFYIFLCFIKTLHTNHIPCTAQSEAENCIKQSYNNRSSDEDEEDEDNDTGSLSSSGSQGSDKHIKIIQFSNGKRVDATNTPSSEDDAAYKSFSSEEPSTECCWPASLLADSYNPKALDQMHRSGLCFTNSRRDLAPLCTNLKSPLAISNDANLMQFSRSSVGGSRFLMSVHPSQPDSSELQFESRFESGNLAKVVKITPVYYELYLRSDMFTNRHSQWFYFRVMNTRKGVPYR